MNVSVDPRKPQTPAPAAPKRKSRAGLWIFLLIVLAAVGYFVFRPNASPEGTGGPGTVAGPGGGRGPGGRGGFQRLPTTVNTEAAKQGDLPNYITSLGTAVALNTATVRSRVDGQLVKINFQDGQQVKQGDILAEIDPRPFEITLQQAQGQLARDRAQLENARLDLQRYQNAQEAVTPQQVDAAKASVAQFEGAVKSDESAVANATLQLGFCSVAAPISGRAGLRQVDAGNLVRSSDSAGIVVITQIQPIAVRFSIPEEALPAVAKALAAGEELNVEIYDRTMKTAIAKGTLVAMDNQIDTSTGTVRLKAVVPNDELVLFPNQFVNVRLLVNVQKNATLVPTSAIQISAQDRYVYVVGPDSTVERRNVKTGNAEGLYTAVSEGVIPGDVVVTEGLDRLQNGSKVVLRAANPVATEGERARGQGAGDGQRRRRREGGQGGGKAP